VKGLGPALVAIDCQGNNLFQSVQGTALGRIDAIISGRT